MVDGLSRLGYDQDSRLGESDVVFSKTVDRLIKLLHLSLSLLLYR